MASKIEGNRGYVSWSMCRISSVLKGIMAAQITSPRSCHSLSPWRSHSAERDEVQSKFTAPTPIIPESATVFDHGLGEWVFELGDPIFTMPGDVPPGLMVWDAQLAHVETAIEQKMDQLLQMLQLSKVLLAGKDAGTAESGTALRFRLIPTLAQVESMPELLRKQYQEC